MNYPEHARLIARGLTTDLDRATAIKRWRKEYKLPYRLIAEMASSWHMPDDASPYFGDQLFGEAVCQSAAEQLGENENDWAGDQ